MEREEWGFQTWFKTCWVASGKKQQTGGGKVKGGLINGFCQSKSSKNFTSVKESNMCLTRNSYNQKGSYGAQDGTEVAAALYPTRRGVGIHPGKQGILRFSSKPVREGKSTFLESTSEAETE